MTESIDEIVAFLEHDATYPCDESGNLEMKVRALIAAWRERGEALERVRLLIFHGPNGGGHSEALATIDVVLKGKAEL